MAKELPFFRFTASEWLMDDISLEPYNIKGLFIDICAYYWMQDCSITLAKLQQKYSNATNDIKHLITKGLIKHESKHDKIKIDFLLTQYDLLSEKRKVRQLAGSRGGNAKALLQQKGSYKYKDNNKDIIDVRKLKFSETLKPFLLKYGKEVLNDFYKYWTEPNKSNTKFRQEMEKTWDLSRRLETWTKNDFGKSKKVNNPNLDGTL